MEEKAVEFRVDSEALRGTLFKPFKKSPFPGVIFYHGRGSSRTRYLPIAEKLSKKGILTLAFDFRGCGESDGIFEKQTHQNGIDDATAALEFFLKENIDKKRIGLCGSSFGAYVISMILAKYPFVKAILLRSPAAYSDKFLKDTGHKERNFYANRRNWEDSSVFQNLKSFRGAVMVLKCENDELVPDEVVGKYYQEAKKASQRKLEVIKGANHVLSNPAHLEEFYQRAHDWFLKTL